MVVCAGPTDLEVTFVTVPIPLSSEMLVAPETDQIRLVDCPAVITDGDAVNDAMVGLGLGGGGV